MRDAATYRRFAGECRRLAMTMSGRTSRRVAGMPTWSRRSPQSNEWRKSGFDAVDGSSAGTRVQGSPMDGPARNAGTRRSDKHARVVCPGSDGGLRARIDVRSSGRKTDHLIERCARRTLVSEHSSRRRQQPERSSSSCSCAFSCLGTSPSGFRAAPKNSGAPRPARSLGTSPRHFVDLKSVLYTGFATRT
jgi:hypothetical protein